MSQCHNLPFPSHSLPQKCLGKEAFLCVALPSGPPLPRQWISPSKCVSNPLKIEPEKCNRVEKVGSHGTQASVRALKHQADMISEFSLLSLNLSALYFTSGKRQFLRNESVYGCFCFRNSLPSLASPSTFWHIPLHHCCSSLKETAGQGLRVWA